MNRKIRFAWAPILLTVLVLDAQPADAAAYLKFDGIDGEATDQDHKGWINLESVSSRMDLTPSSIAATGSAGATGRRGDVVLEDVTITKKTDSASPKLFQAICKGEVIPKLEIDLTSTYGGTRATYLRYELKNVMVTSYSVSGASESGDVPMEEISLNFEEVKVTYTDGAKTKGVAGGNVESSWKVEEGEK